MPIYSIALFTVVFDLEDNQSALFPHQNSPDKTDGESSESFEQTRAKHKSLNDNNMAAWRGDIDSKGVRTASSMPISTNTNNNGNIRICFSVIAASVICILIGLGLFGLAVAITVVLARQRHYLIEGVGVVDQPIGYFHHSKADNIND